MSELPPGEFGVLDDPLVWRAEMSAAEDALQLFMTEACQAAHALPLTDRPIVVAMLKDLYEATLTRAASELDPERTYWLRIRSRLVRYGREVKMRLQGLGVGEADLPPQTDRGYLAASARATDVLVAECRRMAVPVDANAELLVGEFDAVLIALYRVTAAISDIDQAYPIERVPRPSMRRALEKVRRAHRARRFDRR